MTTIDQDLRAMTYLARRLRDETHGCAQWDEAGTFTIFKDTLAGQNLLISLQRVIGHATDPEARTPGAIKRGFVPTPTVAPIHVAYDPRTTCSICGKPDVECLRIEHEFLSVEANRARAPRKVPADLRAAITPTRTWPKAEPVTTPRPDPAQSPAPTEHEEIPT